MKLKIMSWNVKGINDVAKRSLIRAFIKSQRVDLGCLQETKLREISRGLIRSLGVGNHLEWVVVKAKGSSGGIVVFWDSRVLKLLGVEESHYTISCRFSLVEEHFTWVFTGVYGPTSRGCREALWDELGAIRGLWGDPWCIGGDFNIITFPSERNREGRLSGSMRRFSQVLDDLELKDLPLQGGLFTWKGGPSNTRMARLDRFLVTEEWDSFFGGARQSILPRPTSDHFSVLLERGGGGIVGRGPSPFKFENMWLKEEGFKDLVGEWWQGLVFRWSKSYYLSEKLKALKGNMRGWNKDVFGRVEENKKVALKKVAYWDDLKNQAPFL